MYRRGMLGREAVARAVGLVLAVVLLLAVPAFAQEGEEGVPAMGDEAPGFSLKGSDGKTYTLEQFKGKKPVILAFFPKSFTPG